MTNNSLVESATQSHSLAWNSDQIDLVKRTIAKGCTSDELQLFMHVCKRTGLDPFAKQIYAVSRYDSRQKKNVMSIQTGIDGFRLIAQRSGDYAGQLGPYWCGEDGIWRDVWTDKDFPVAAKVAILRSDFKEPLWAVAKWDSYVQTFKDGNPMGMWSKMPDLMLAKCAEALALRKGFPQELSGIYTADEMAQADNHQPRNTVSPPEGNLATEKQRRMLHAKCKEHEISPEYVKGFVKERFNKDSSKEITKAEFQTLHDHLFPEVESEDPGDGPIDAAWSEQPS